MSVEENQKLEADFIIQDSEEALSYTCNFKAPGHNGFHACFYKQMWQSFKHEVHPFFQSFKQ